MLAALILAAALAAPEPASGPAPLARLSVEETALTGRQAQEINRFARLLSVLQQFRRDPPPALLVSPADAKRAVRAAILVKAMTPELEARASAYAREAADIARRRRLAAVRSEALFTRESLAADHAPAPASPTLTPRVSNGPLRPPARLAYPVAAPVRQAFGAPVPGGGRAEGITFAVPAGGARVTSPGQGVVQYVGAVRGWGVILILRLDGGYHLVLAGLDKAQARIGQSVAPGQPVGSMPDGRQSPSDLYLEVRERGAPVDPARWLRRK